MTDDEVFEHLPTAAALVKAVHDRDQELVATCLASAPAEVLSVILAGLHWDLAEARNEALRVAAAAKASEAAAYENLRHTRERMKGLERDVDAAAERFRKKVAA